jgi:NAD(P)-dependent dehydrogenase (short-subunit alcohol dehydrogenase family)
MSQNKVIVITGATRGVGRNITRFFAEKGIVW